MFSSEVNEKKAVALSSVAASFFLTGGKLAVGIMTGSLGILSEAAHSALDLVAALITYFAVRVSDKPANEEFHYGHAKVENFSAFLESILLFLTCLWIIKEALYRLIFQETHIEVTIWSYVILIVSIVIDFSRARALNRAAQKYNSQALEADALHFSSDILSSLVVLVGIIFARFGITYADPVAALVVACIVIYASWQLAAKTMDALLDKAPRGLDRKIADEVKQIPGVTDVHKIRLRQAGGKVHGDLHVVMESNVSFVDGHRIADQVEEKLAKYSDDILVHFEPEDNWKELSTKVDEIRKMVRRILDRDPGDFKGYHDLEVTHGPEGISVSIHLVMPQGASVLEARACCDSLEHILKQELLELREANLHFNIEPCPECRRCGRCPNRT